MFIAGADETDDVLLVLLVLHVVDKESGWDTKLDDADEVEVEVDESWT